MQNLSYEEILEMKAKCYEVIKEHLGNEYLRVFKYYKGDLLPLIHTKVRKNMTCGDIDTIQWDYWKKKIRFIESKRIAENHKDSQTKLLKFLSDIQIPDYQVDVVKIVADPPFQIASLINMKNDKKYNIDHDELIKFLNM